MNRCGKIASRIVGQKAFVTSVPKAGTHLLVHTLSCFPNLYDHGTLVYRSQDEQLLAIRHLTRGSIVSSHMVPDPRLLEILTGGRISTFFIIRDPRDVCVSLMHYIRREPDHYFHRFLDSFADDDSLLSAIIHGYSEPRGSEHAWLGSIDSVYRRRLGWCDIKSCLTVRFEDLVGEEGGGDRSRQRDTLTRVAHHLSLRLSSEKLDEIASSVFSTTTTTFRRGRIGAWKETFTADHRSQFKSVAGPLLIDLGYEAADTW